MDEKCLTPIEKVNGYYLKRDDFYNFGNAIGGKARVAAVLIKEAIFNGFRKIVTAGSRDSRQCDIVSAICDGLNVECHIFMPNGKDTAVSKSIEYRSTSKIHRTKAGYNNVIISHSIKWSEENSGYYIPFGMETQRCIDINSHQVQNIPKNVNRIIVPCGSGMQMISIIHGLKQYGKEQIKVIGVQVGANPYRVINKYLPCTNLFDEGWNYEIIKSPTPYSTALDAVFCNVRLDPMYEAKCVPFIEKGDLLWIVGNGNK